jgi:hypothetical protein
VMRVPIQPVSRPRHSLGLSFLQVLTFLEPGGHAHAVLGWWTRLCLRGTRRAYTRFQTEKSTPRQAGSGKRGSNT